MTPSPGPLPTTTLDEPDWLATVTAGLRHVGCAVVEDAVPTDLLAAVRLALPRAQAAVEAAVGRERLERAGELGVIRLPMLFEPVLLELLALPAVLAVVDATVSPTAVLHLQNGLALPPLPPAGAPPDIFQLRFHPDFPRVLNGYLCSINTFFALDPFRADNGATLLVPGTHQSFTPPAAEYLRRQAVPALCRAGAMVVFDSTLWHAAGVNRSPDVRLALNQQFTRSYFKPQIDYVRALGEDRLLALPPRTQQLLGGYTRVPASLDEYYRPPAERLYRGGQG